MSRYTLEEILRSPNEEFDNEFSNINNYINSKENDDNQNTIIKKKEIKQLINKYQNITNKILLLKIYELNNQIDENDLILINDPFFESYLLGEMLGKHKSINELLTDINLIKIDYFHTNCSLNNFENFKPIDPISLEPITSKENTKILNGRCYEKSVIVNWLKINNTDPMSNELVSLLTIERMFNSLPTEDQTIATEFKNLSTENLNTYHKLFTIIIDIAIKLLSTSLASSGYSIVVLFLFISYIFRTVKLTIYSPYILISFIKFKIFNPELGLIEFKNINFPKGFFANKWVHTERDMLDF